MNKQRRKQLDKIATRMEALSGSVQEIIEELQTVMEEEEEYLENVPENLLNGDAYLQGEEAFECMTNVIEEMEATDLGDLAVQLRSSANIA